MKTLRRLILLILCLFLVVSVSGCNGGGSSSPAPPMNVSGTWTGTLTYADCNCSAGNWTVNITDNNGVLTGNGSVNSGNCGTYSGTISGTYDNSSGKFVQGIAIGGGGAVNFNGQAGGSTVSGSWNSTVGCSGTFEGTLQ